MAKLLTGQLTGNVEELKRRIQAKARVIRQMKDCGGTLLSFMPQWGLPPSQDEPTTPQM